MKPPPKGNEMETTEVTEISKPKFNKTSCMEMASTATTVIQATVAVGSLVMLVLDVKSRYKASKARKLAEKPITPEEA
jgi:hypothetical protein